MTNFESIKELDQEEFELFCKSILFDACPPGGEARVALVRGKFIEWLNKEATYDYKF